MILSKEEFLDRMRRNGLRCDLIDAFYIIHYYHEDNIEGITTSLSQEDELSLMLYRLLGHDVDEEDFLKRFSKKCIKCERDFTLNHFSMNMQKADRRETVCRFCLSKKPNAYENWLENEKLLKKCRVCKIEKTLNNFKIGGRQTKWGRIATCKSCHKKLDGFYAKRRDNSPDAEK
jgi:hypothetical protein